MVQRGVLRQGPLEGAQPLGGRSGQPGLSRPTFHHPFYDVTRGAFVEAVNLQAGDRLRDGDGGEATVYGVAYPIFLGE